MRLPDLADSDSFRLRPLVVAAVVEIVGIVVGVEVRRVDRRDDLLEFISAVVDQLALIGPDRERACAERPKLLITSVAVDVAVGLGDGQPPEVFILLELSRIGERSRVQLQLFDSLFLSAAGGRRLRWR